MCRTVNTAAGTAVVFPCAVCGKPVTVVSTDRGAQIRDLPAFLATHRKCLRKLSLAADAGDGTVVLPD